MDFINNDSTKKEIKHIDIKIENEKDLLYAIALFGKYNTFSLNSIQNEYNLGFNRAISLLTKLVDLGIIKEKEGTNPRVLLVDDEEEIKNLIYD